MGKVSKRSKQRPLAPAARTNSDSSSSIDEWTHDELTEFLFASGVLSRAGIYGVRKAAADAFRTFGYRLATIQRERPPHQTLYQFSAYATGKPQRRTERQMRQIVRDALRFIGCPPDPKSFAVVVSGRRLLVSSLLPEGLPE